MGQHHQPLRPQQHPAWQRATIRRLAYDPNSAKQLHYNQISRNINYINTLHILSITKIVFIDGRTVNDLEESYKHHDYESTTTSLIRIVSWDTWLRRLKRL